MITGKSAGKPGDDPQGDLAVSVRVSRRALGLTQSDLARRAGITASYVSRIESAAWERGGPWPSDEVLRALARALNCSSTQLIAQRSAAQERVQAMRPGVLWPRAKYGVSVGDEAVRRAAQGLLERNPRRGAVRLTSPLLEGQAPGDDLTAALGRKLADDTTSVLYRMCVVDGAADRARLDCIRSTTERLACGRDPSSIYNVRNRCAFAPPSMLDVMVGEQEALIAVPDRRGHPSMRACVVVDDPDLVAALKVWYDDFVWEPLCGYVDLRYDRLDETLAQIEERMHTQR